jgi:photosystem II stability/assembly factor-like uncharacterized protein
VDVAGPGLGLVGLGTDPQVGSYARLMVTADGGVSFEAIGPRTADWTTSDSVFFLSRADGWYTVANVNTLAETLFRTTDGGASWRSSSVVGHAMAAGSTDTVQFITPTRGWLLNVEPTAPDEALYTTTNGGATWRMIARLRPMAAPGAPGVLPELSPVRFAADGTGWLGGGPFSRALYRSSDDGHSWRRVPIRARPGSVFGLPSQFGATLIEPVTSGPALTLYRSTDSGADWSVASVQPDAVSTGTCAAPVSVSFVSSRIGWASAIRAGHTVVYRTTDGGLRWATSATSWYVAPDMCTPTQIQATDGDHAWLLTAGARRIYATSDGGKSWRRIDTSAIRAAARVLQVQALG